MPKALIKNLSIYGALFAVIFGSLSHFFYQWSSNNFFVGLFSPVNESLWEHMKMVFVPFILFAFLDYYYLRKVVRNYFFALAKQIFSAIVFILVVFYTYTAIVGDSILLIDISSFVVGIILAKYLGYKILTGSFKKWQFSGINVFSLIMLLMLGAFFIYATINPPRIKLFNDSITDTYGIFQKK